MTMIQIYSFASLFHLVFAIFDIIYPTKIIHSPIQPKGSSLLSVFSEKEQNLLLKEMPKASSCKNPIDILGDATSKRYAQILQNLKDVEQESEKEFAYLILLTQQSMTDSENIVKEIEIFQKNNPEQIIITSFMGGEDVSSARKMLKEKNILHFDYPREAISAYEKLLIQQ